MSQPVFDDRDREILEKTLNLRMRMMDVIARKGDDQLPSKPSELLAIAQLAGSIDKTVIDRAKVRSEENSSQSQEKDRAVLLNLMRHMHQNSSKPTELIETAATVIPSFVSNSDAKVSSGELIRREDNIDLSDMG